MGQRAARLLAREGAHVRVGSRSRARADAVCTALAEHVDSAQLEPVATGNSEELSAALESVQLVVAAGAAGVTLLPSRARKASRAMCVAIDLKRADFIAHQVRFSQTVAGEECSGPGTFARPLLRDRKGLESDPSPQFTV